MVSTEKGFGFITHSVGSDHTDYFFHISSVDGPDAPGEGDLVEFQESETKRGKAALDVRILEKSGPKSRTSNRRNEDFPKTARSESRDDRVKCKHCGKRMVPRVQFSKGEPVGRLCPFCMKSQESQGGGCFIATAAFDGESHPTIAILREFRDRRLLKFGMGRKFASTYYSTSPHLAKWLEFNSFWKPPIRWILTKLANVLRHIL